MLFKREEFVLVMVPSKLELERYAAMKDVLISQRKEEFAIFMVPRGRLATMKDAQMLL